MEQILNFFKTFLIENKEKIINISFYSLILLTIYFFAKKIIYKIVKLGIKKIKIEEKLNERIKILLFVLNSILKVIIFLILFLLVLKEFDIKLIPFITGLGFIGGAFIVIFQNTIQDIIKGWLILFEDQLREGEWIIINNTSQFTGKVIKINLRYIVLKDKEGNLIFFPNSQISSIINLSRENKVFTFKIKIDKNVEISQFIDDLNNFLEELKKENSKILKFEIVDDIKIFLDFYELTISFKAHKSIGEKYLAELKLRIFKKYEDKIKEVI